MNFDSNHFFCVKGLVFFLLVLVTSHQLWVLHLEKKKGNTFTFSEMITEVSAWQTKVSQYSMYFLCLAKKGIVGGGDFNELYICSFIVFF